MHILREFFVISSWESNLILLKNLCRQLFMQLKLRTMRKLAFIVAII